MRQKNTLKPAVVQLRQSLENYLKDNGINDDNYISHMGNSQHFHAYALLHTIKIFQQLQQESDYERLNQHIAGFLQSAKVERCFYENKNLVKMLDSYLNIQKVSEGTQKYSPLLSMRISNDISIVRAHHLKQRNLWQKMKSFFVGGFYKAQERVDLKGFRKEYSEKADAIKSVAEFNDFEARYTKPLEKRIKLLPIIDRREKTAVDLETLVAETRVDIEKNLGLTDTFSGQLHVLISEKLSRNGALNQVVFTKENAVVAPMEGSINLNSTVMVTATSYPDSWLSFFYRKRVAGIKEQQSPLAAQLSLSASKE